MGKVRYGIKNCHYAVWDATDGSYGTPVAAPGAVQLTLDAQGNSSNFYADDSTYETFTTNAGYSGSLQLAVAEDQLLIDLLGYVRTANGTLVEPNDAQPASFALLFEVEGNVANTRFVLYNCKLSRPSTEANTTTEDTTPDTATLNITAISRDFGGRNVVKGHLERTEANAAAFDAWFQQVTPPDFTAPEPGGGSKVGEAKVGSATVA